MSAGLPFAASSLKPRISAEDLMALMACSPFCQALGLAPASNDGAVALLLKAQPSWRDEKDGALMHAGAIAGVLDNALAIGANVTLPEGSRPATIDLRWEMFSPPPLTAIAISANAATIAPEAVFVLGEIADAQSGAVFGRAAASVAYSAPKEGVGKLYPAPPEPQIDAANFYKWLGLEASDGTYMAPYHPRLRGAAGLPYWHGGALMAAMTAAASSHVTDVAPHARLMAATVNFDVFAVDAPLEIDCREFRATRTRAAVHVRASQGGRGVVCRLTGHFALKR